MDKIVVYPNFAGVDVKEDKGFDYAIENIALNKLIRNEKFKDEKHFSTVEKKQQLDKMSEKLDELPPILVIKHPLLKNKYAILDGHHRFQLFNELGKKTIPAKVLDDSVIFLAKNEYGTKNNKATRLDKINTEDFDLKKYFNTDLDESISEDKIPGGLAKGKTIIDLAKKWDPKGYYDPKQYAKEVINKKLEQGIKVEMEHTTSSKIAKEIAMDHLWEDIKYYDKLAKMETKESMGADSAGGYEGPMTFSMKKKDIDKIKNWGDLKEALEASASGEFDVPLFGGTKGRKNPLSISGPKSIKKRINKIKGPKFPKWGGPKSVFVQVKEKCKKFPYCNQGDINALEISEIGGLTEAINEMSKKYGISTKEIETIVINEIRRIFI